MKRLQTVIVAALLAVGALGLAPGSVAASVQGSCSPSDTSKIYMRENPLGDNTNGNDTLWYCTGNAQLSTVAVSGNPPRGCKGFGLFSNHADWNDCVDSYEVFVPAGMTLCIYRDDWFNYLIDVIVNPVGNATRVEWREPTLRDAMSSLLWVTGDSSYC